MKKRYLAGALFLLLAVIPAAAQGRGTTPFQLTLGGGAGANQISVSLSGDRSHYVIKANGTISCGATMFPGARSGSSAPRPTAVPVLA